MNQTGDQSEKTIKGARILVADAHPVAIYGTIAALRQAGAGKIVGVTTRQQLLNEARTFDPDIIISEMKLADGYAMPAIARVRAMYWKKPFIVFTWLTHNDMMMRAHALRVMAYIYKSQPLSDLVAAANAAVNGIRTWNNADFWSACRWRTKPKAHGVMDVCLTPAQLSILLAAHRFGLYKLVAKKLKMSLMGVKMSIFRLLREVGLNDREELFEWFFNHVGPVSG